MAEGSKYLVRDTNGNVYGPADGETLRAWVREGRIVPGMAIAPRETREWVEASAHPELAEVLAARAAEVQRSEPAAEARREVVKEEPARPEAAGPAAGGEAAGPQGGVVGEEVRRVEGAAPEAVAPEVPTLEVPRAEVGEGVEMQRGEDRAVDAGGGAMPVESGGGTGSVGTPLEVPPSAGETLPAVGQGGQAAGSAEVVSGGTGGERRVESVEMVPVTEWLPEGSAGMQGPVGQQAGAVTGPYVGEYVPPGYAVGPRQNVLGVLSFISGLLGLLLSCGACACILFWPLAGLLALSAIVMGAISIYQINANPIAYHGKGLAVAGVSLGACTLLLFALGIVLTLVLGWSPPVAVPP